MADKQRANFFAMQMIGWKTEIERAAATLRGVMVGLRADGELRADEIDALGAAIKGLGDLAVVEPFSDVVNQLQRVLSTRVLDAEDLADFIWVLDQWAPNRPYFTTTTRALQELRGVLAGVTADGVVTETELRRLRDWVEDHADVRKLWPCSEVDSLITATLRDGRIDADEQRRLLAFFDQVGGDGSASGVEPSGAVGVEVNLGGILAVDPEIRFPGQVFCITGDSPRGPRSLLEDAIAQRGGEVRKSVSKQLDFLIVGGEGSDMWAFAAYGRKVEKAMELRKAGAELLIVSERDFWDACGE